jgi:hypothetical protein
METILENTYLRIVDCSLPNAKLERRHNWDLQGFGTAVRAWGMKRNLLSFCPGALLFAALWLELARLGLSLWQPLAILLGNVLRSTCTTGVNNSIE